MTSAAPAPSRAPAVAIAAIVVAVVAMLIVPLPRPLLDALLVLNIGAAVALLMAAVFAPRPTSFASFPTLLVVTTLFRVGLEVSVTRLILADADAGDVVRAFGDSVVAGSLVVGLVVFAVITIVQLVVVSRGAERVAEVAARFALDAMPGKQMAIDAEQRSGAIDAAAARVRRGELERESQLYGAMDGAMRFVKGDAIAAIVIVVINLVGGLVIGVGSRGLSAADAAHTYSLLSIGEGLVAQIPSLLVAVASGLLVTRVASAGDRPLGDDLPEQLAGSPRALVGAAIVLAGLAAAPGLPMLPFALLAAVAAGGALAVRRSRARASALLPATSDVGEPGSAAAVPRVTLRLSAKLYDQLVGRNLHPPAALHAALAAARADVRAAVPVPPLAVAADADLRDTELALAIDATPSAYLALAAAELADVPAALRAKLPALLAQLAPELVTVDRVAALVEAAALHAPIVVREVVPRAVSLPVLADILRGLARERVPLDDLPAILEAIARAPGLDTKALDVATVVEHVRAQLRRQISARFAPRGELAVHTVDAMIEDALRTSLDRRDGGVTVLAIEPAIAHDIVAAVRAAKPSVILASSDVRRHLRALLEPELPDVAVVAAHELAPGTSVRTAGRIEV
nr:flagellar biosynthesis protein FlhA [Kofleriaceae bacterium]